MSTKEINTKDYQLHEGDTGSAPYQVALLTQRIHHLTDHLNANKKDFSSRRGLLTMVSRRRKLLDFIRNGSEEKYQQVIQGLGLRHYHSPHGSHGNPPVAVAQNGPRIMKPGGFPQAA